MGSAMPRRRPPWIILAVLLVGLAVVYGGFSVYADQRSGVAGKAKVTECEGGTGRYDTAIRCRGIWSVGGDPVFGDGQFATGPIEGAERGDVGKTLDVRIHGADHATVPGLATPIVLWALGAAVALLAFAGLWNWWRDGRRAAALPVPSAIREHVAALVRERWSGKDPEPVVDALPRAMPAGAVRVLASGGPYGWLIQGRLDLIGGRLALEALEDDRMNGPSHYRIWEDGTCEHLPGERTGYGVPPACPPEEAQRIEDEYLAHNRAVQEALRERGFGRA